MNNNNINRGAFRVSEQGLAQHETALANTISKMLMREQLDIGQVVTATCNVKPVGTFLITGIYVDGKFHSVLKTWADLSDVYDIKSQVETEWCFGLPERID